MPRRVVALPDSPRAGPAPYPQVTAHERRNRCLNLYTSTPFFYFFACRKYPTGVMGALRRRYRKALQGRGPADAAVRATTRPRFGVRPAYPRRSVRVLKGTGRFSPDDGHVFCRPDQVEEEIVGALGLSLRAVRAFGLDDFRVRLATMPERHVGEAAQWEMATGALRLAVEACSVPYEEEAGGGAFYGPKIDLEAKDALGRQWRISAAQKALLPRDVGVSGSGSHPVQRVDGSADVLEGQASEILATRPRQI